MKNKYYRSAKINGDMDGLPTWRVDNLYTFIISTITMTITISGFYFAMVNRLNLIENNQTITNRQLTEITSLMKERRVFNDDTRGRVITLEAEIKQLQER